MRHLSVAPCDVYSGLVQREDGRLVVHCLVKRKRVAIEDCTRCGRLVGLRAGGLQRHHGVYMECRPLGMQECGAVEDWEVD